MRLLRAGHVCARLLNCAVMRHQPSAELRLEFAAWLDKFLVGLVANQVAAFVFNVYEGDVSFDVQLDGAASFDPADDSWASQRIVSTGEDLFSIPRDAVGDSWEAALDVVRQLVRQYLVSGLHAGKLKQAQAVAVGFVDGDLELVPNA
jgi:hypothetical protein